MSRLTKAVYSMEGLTGKGRIHKIEGVNTEGTTMKIHGLQKMTLLDFPGRVACTVFLGGCDLRCPFCHNAELIDGTAPAVMDDTELLAFLKKRQGLLEGVAITGGEPLLRGEELVTLAEKSGTWDIR